MASTLQTELPSQPGDRILSYSLCSLCSVCECLVLLALSVAKSIFALLHYLSPLSRSIGYGHVGLCLGSLFSSPDLFVYSFVNTTLSDDYKVTVNLNEGNVRLLTSFSYNTGLAIQCLLFVHKSLESVCQ